MLWSFSTNAFTDRSIFAAVAEIAAAGYRGVEILADRPHLNPADAGPRELDRLAGLLAGLDMVPVSLNANTVVGFYGRDFWEPLYEPSLANPDPAARRWRLSQVRRCLAMAQDLGCSHVSVTSGRPVPGTAPSRSLDLLTHSLRELAEYAAETSVRIGIEYEPGLLVENARELAALLDRLRSPWIGACLDVGHSRIAGERLDRVLDRLGDRIFHVHLEDIRGRKHYHLVPGEGDIDIAGVLESLEDHGYRGFVTVELHTCRNRPVAAAVAALNHLESLTGEKDGRYPGDASNPASILWPCRQTITGT